MDEADWAALQKLKDHLDLQEGRTLVRLAQARVAGACSAELIVLLGRWFDALLEVHLVLSGTRRLFKDTDCTRLPRPGESR